MAGLRLPSEALGLTAGDVHVGRLYIEGRSSSGEYLDGSKTGPGRDLPLRPELAEEFAHTAQICRDAGRRLASSDFWISARRGGGIWSEHQANNWRRRDFRPVVQQVATDYPQFSGIARATPYATRHTFISCCLQAGLSLATIAAWCGTSIQMISATYGRMIRRHEGASPITLDEQFRAGKVEAMSLLSATTDGLAGTATGRSTGPIRDPATGPGRSNERAVDPGLRPLARRRKIAD
jgi:integrase